MTTRDTMLARIDEAARRGSDHELARPLPGIGEHDRAGDVPNGGLVARFVDEARAVGTVVHTATSMTEAGEVLARIAAHLPSGCRIAAWSSPLAAALVDAARPLAPALVAIDAADAVDADVGVTEADALVAASGTLVLGAAAGRRRVTSLLPRVHIAIATVDRIVPDLASGLRAAATGGAGGACTTLVTGPSRTADIEKKLVVGVHGPCELHVILLGAPRAAD